MRALSVSVWLVVIALVTTTLAGCARKAEGEQPIDGIGKFQYAVENGWASLTVVFEKLRIDAGARIPLQQLEGGFIEIAPDFLSGGTLFKVAVPLTALMQANQQQLPVVGLPDGRPLPGVREGALGAFAVNVPSLGLMYFYVSRDAYGFFAPLPLPNLPVMISTNVRDDKGNLLGVIYGIPKGKTGSVSGALFLFSAEGM